MKDIVLASYRTNTEADIEADLIVNNEACSFIELITVGGGVQAIDDGMEQLMQNPQATGVVVLHGESLQQLIDAYLRGAEA
ncbi:MULTISPECIES: hypothetical protein [unclassified Acinetobacter]|uniref:hypothetical protein n=1 Tax=unclassified Acinetobacter TaxID=196816 RepID=UPI000DD08C6C|nr:MULTISPECIES: hypothetical protein [unclassified Acinetobacter]